MKSDHSKLLAQFISGVFGAGVLAVLGLLLMSVYGGNYGCWSAVDSFFSLRGYESCGKLGAYIGLILGSIFGVLLSKKIKSKKPSRVFTALMSLLIVLMFVLSLNGYLMDNFGLFISLIKAITSVLLLVITLCLPSAILIVILNWKTLFKK